MAVTNSQQTTFAVWKTKAMFFDLKKNKFLVNKLRAEFDLLVKMNYKG